MAKLVQMPSRIPDALAREQALDVDRSWIVEAPAGSGKTGLLLQRYLRLLGHPSVTDPEQVLAITFTKAATEEIRRRILRELQQAHDASDQRSEASDFDRLTRSLARAALERDRTLSWNLLDDPRRLRIRTIDAVCAEIARSLPILCGGNGSLTPVEEPSFLYEEAARRTWSHLGGTETALAGALHDLLLHRDGDLNACISLVAGMLAEREQWGSLIPLQEEDFSVHALDLLLRKKLDQSLEQVVCEGLTRLSEAFPEPLLRRLTSLANSLSARSGYDNRPSPIAICRELHSAPSAAAESLVHWRALAHLLIAPTQHTWRKSFARNHISFETDASDKALLKQLALEAQEHPALLDLLNELGTLPPSRFPDEQWPITKALFRVLRRALAELQVVFSETGKSDFTEPSLLARYALQQQHGMGALESSLGTELKHLLVDEMQDTSSRQYELIEHLTDGWADEGKTVFLVGDPKQSIYLFRQARVERFVESMRTGRLGNLPIGPLYLTANFRSQAGLVAAFNEDFGRVFPQQPKHSEAVEYVFADATRKATLDVNGSNGTAWHLTVLPADAQDSRQRVKAQAAKNARNIRHIIERWRARPLPADRTSPWRIAILVRSRSSLTAVLSELRRDTPIPFRALKIDTLDERREILDLLALTRALLHPADRTAWLAVLHAPWCGLGMADLHTLTGRDDLQSRNLAVADLIARWGTELSADGLLRLERSWPTLQAAVRTSPHVRLPERVERTWRSLGGNLFLDQTALRNVSTFLDLLRTIDREAGEVRIPTLMRRLKHLYASPDNTADAVDLITIHGSKGLEWDVVLVPELERRSPRDASRLFEWEESRSGNVILSPIAAKGEEATSLNGWLRSLQARRAAAERKRLFYVACTRAREELHLFGVACTQKNGGVTAESGSLLDAAWPAAKERLATPAHTASASVPPSSGTLDLAATGDEAGETIAQAAPQLERLPLSVRPFPLFSGYDGVERTSTAFNGAGTLRPYGSFASRCLGVTIHTFLEEAARSLAGGRTVQQLLRELPAWEPRLRAVARANGLPPDTVQQHVQIGMTALRKTLSDPVGQWLLTARTHARNELAITTWDEQPRRSRIDRIFRAGPAPCDMGDQHLWIIDYKTASHATGVNDDDALETLLNREQERHRRQLENYAHIFDEEEIRLGLWFPLLGQLRWWNAEKRQHGHEADPRTLEQLSPRGSP